MLQELEVFEDRVRAISQRIRTGGDRCFADEFYELGYNYKVLLDELGYGSQLENVAFYECRMDNCQCNKCFFTRGFELDD